MSNKSSIHGEYHYLSIVIKRHLRALRAEFLSSQHLRLWRRCLRTRLSRFRFSALSPVNPMARTVNPRLSISQCDVKPLESFNYAKSCTPKSGSFSTRLRMSRRGLRNRSSAGATDVAKDFVIENVAGERHAVAIRNKSRNLDE
jgi:hypothetical protein